MGSTWRFRFLSPSLGSFAHFCDKAWQPISEESWGFCELRGLQCSLQDTLVSEEGAKGGKTEHWIRLTLDSDLDCERWNGLRMSSTSPSCYIRCTPLYTPRERKREGGTVMDLTHPHAPLAFCAHDRSREGALFRSPRR